jgi:hypothetical protein
MIDENVSAPVTAVAPAVITTTSPPACDRFGSYGGSALCWYGFGFKVIPIAPGTKKTTEKWDPWLDGQSPEKISKHWAENPGHEIGLIVGDEIIVFDADGPESAAALADTEKAHDVTPNFVVKTRKGEHHYFKRATGTHAKSDSHSTESHPERIDVKTGRALVVLPPSTGKSIALMEAQNAGELTEVGQDFIDAVFRHNGRVAPRAPEVAPSPCIRNEPQSQEITCLKALLDYVDPDSGYDDWLRVLMAIFYETGGSDGGLKLADAWSSRGKTYKGIKEITAKWKSFRLDHPNPVTIATLKRMVAANGHDWMAICSAAESSFLPVNGGKGKA